MTVKALMPVHTLNLVAPLPHKGTAMREAETGQFDLARSGAVSPLIGINLRRGDVDSANERRPPAATRGTRTSTTATRTTTTRVLRPARGLSADPSDYCFEQLVQAYLDCRKAKRNTASALAFEDRLEANLIALHEELCSGQYSPGRSICFVITRPKPREVWAGDFRDRIVHHLVYNAIGPAIEARFIGNSHACIKGRGTLHAAERLEHAVRSITQNWSVPAFYLKLDLSNFFVSIDKHILFAQLSGHVQHPWWLSLAQTVLFHDARNDVEVRGSRALLSRVPPHKSLFNAPGDTGLPIGNLSSQFFANVHLDALDQFCKHQLKAKHYGRYVDDFYLLHTDPQQLVAWLRAIDEFLPSRLGARLNPKKTILQPLERGIDFVGFVIKPWRRTTRKRTVNTAIQRIRTMPDADTFAAGNSYLGLARQAGHSHRDQVRIAKALMQRGHAVAGDLGKVFRTKA